MGLEIISLFFSEGTANIEDDRGGSGDIKVKWITPRGLVKEFMVQDLKKKPDGNIRPPKRYDEWSGKHLYVVPRGVWIQIRRAISMMINQPDDRGWERGR